MSEIVLYEWTEGEDRRRIVGVPGTIRPFSTEVYYPDEDYWSTASADAAERRVLHMASALSAAEDRARRARVEGMREALGAIQSYVGPEPRDFTAHRQVESGKELARKSINRLIAAAEMELDKTNGGTDAQG